MHRITIRVYIDYVRILFRLDEPGAGVNVLPNIRNFLFEVFQDFPQSFNNNNTVVLSESIL